MLYELAAVRVFLRIVAITLDLIFLDEVAEHKDVADIVLLDHPPEIVETVRERPLGCNDALSFHFHKVGVYVILHLILLWLIS